MTQPDSPPPIGFDSARFDWHDKSVLPPSLVPVLGEFHAWNDPDHELMYHVVWWFNGEWRTYPLTDDYAYVDRWALLPRDSDTHPKGRNAVERFCSWVARWRSQSPNPSLGERGGKR